MSGKRTVKAASATKSAKKSGAPRSVGALPAVSAAVAQATVATSAAARHAEELLALIARRKAQIAEAFYDMGRALRELSKKKLYSALGYGSFGELLVARSVMSRAQAHKLISIASVMSAQTALSLGVEKAFQLARYTKATPALDTPESVLLSGESVGDKPAAQATVQELARAAAREKKKASPSKKDAAEKAAGRTAKRAVGWLAERGARGAEVRAVRRKGGWRVLIEIEADAAEALFTG